MVAQRLIPSKFSPIPHSQMILPLDSTDASHKQINERQSNVMHINMLPPKPVTKYVTLTVNVADKLAALLLVSMSLRFPPRTCDQLRLLLIVISWFPPRKQYYKYRHSAGITATVPKNTAFVPQNIVTARQNTARILKIPPQ